MNNLYVVSCQRNANVFSKNCLESVARQTKEVKEHIFIDDVSSDDTVKHVQEYIDTSPKNNIRLISNENRKYRLKNIRDAIHQINDPEGIVLLLDGDDWFSTTEATKIVHSVYENNSNLEYVYTNWMFSHDGQLGISKPIPSNDWCAYRDPWITSAMATFKVKTFMSIPESNFLDDDGDYFKMGTDHAYVLPITHMLKKKYGDYRAVGFIDSPLYVYQFVENAKRRRVDTEGQWETNEAHRASSLIRKRGFLND